MTLDELEQILRLDGLREIPIHSGRQAARLIPVIACAVNATIGRWRPVSRSLPRMTAVHSKPSITGI